MAAVPNGGQETSILPVVTLAYTKGIVKSGVGRGLTHLLHLPLVRASIVKFRVRFACCGINVGALKYEYGCIVYLFTVMWANEY